jgi:NADPH-dependent 2,4-dienoyl-CoA reductase/sulfur reductase-like enzyme
VVSGVRAEDGRATGVVLADGRTVEADAVLVGIGAVPNTGWLAGSGVPVGNGVECDATLHAGGGVWAAGDVACWAHPRTGTRTRIEHRTNAAEQGLAVARNILAAPGAAAPFDPVPFVWSDQYDLRVQIYGRTRGADRIRITEGSTAERRLVAVYGDGDRVCGVVGINMPRQTRGHRALVAEGAEWSSLPAGGELPVAR